jgi:hypothetical protein
MVPSSLGVPWPPTKFFVLRTIVPRINRSHRVSIDWGTVSGIMGHNNCSWVPSRSPLGRHLSPVGLLDVTVQKARWLRARSSTSRDHLRSKSLNFILSLGSLWDFKLFGRNEAYQSSAHSCKLFDVLWMHFWSEHNTESQVRYLMK